MARLGLNKTYVVGGLRDVAESWRGDLGDELLNPDVFRHDCGGDRCVFVVGRGTAM